MHNQPFAIFSPFAKNLSVRLYDKADNLNVQKDLPGILGKNFAVPKQVHGAHSIVVRKPQIFAEEADAIATDVPGLTLALCCADCQVWTVYAPQKNVVALAHAGWRGLLRGVLPSLYQLLHEEWEIEAEETLAACGPSLCKACAEFTDPIRELPGVDPHFFDGHHADLHGIARKELEDLGVEPGNIAFHPDCTRCHHNRYWTYRGGDRDAVLQDKENVLACTLLQA